MSVFLVFKLVFSLIDKEVDERPAGRRVGLVSQDMDYDNSFGLQCGRKREPRSRVSLD